MLIPRLAYSSHINKAATTHKVRWTIQMTDKRGEPISCSEQPSRGALLLAALDGFDPEYVAELERKPITAP